MGGVLVTSLDQLRIAFALGGEAAPRREPDAAGEELPRFGRLLPSLLHHSPQQESLLNRTL